LLASSLQQTSGARRLCNKSLRASFLQQTFCSRLLCTTPVARVFSATDYVRAPSLQQTFCARPPPPRVPPFRRESVPAPTHPCCFRYSARHAPVTDPTFLRIPPTCACPGRVRHCLRQHITHTTGVPFCSARHRLDDSTPPANDSTTLLRPPTTRRLYLRSPSHLIRQHASTPSLSPPARHTYHRCS
jgi:hypothetical protein